MGPFQLGMMIGLFFFYDSPSRGFHEARADTLGATCGGEALLRCCAVWKGRSARMGPLASLADGAQQLSGARRRGRQRNSSFKGRGGPIAAHTGELLIPPRHPAALHTT